MSSTPEEHEPRTDAKRARLEGRVDAGMLPEFPSNFFDTLAHPSPTYEDDGHKHMQPHSSGQKRRREVPEDAPSETLSQTSYSDAESVACTDAGDVSEEGPIDLGLKLAAFPSDLLILLAQTLGNPLELLVAKAHLSKAFCEAARAAQGLLTQVDLSKWHLVTDETVKAVASRCKQLATLDLSSCRNITDAAVVAVASGCKQLTTLNLFRCSNITDAAVRAVVTGSAGKQLTWDEVQWLRMQCCNSAWLRRSDGNIVIS